MRRGGIGSAYIRSRFNPRICKRCDTNNIKADTSKKVSIHASVKDATLIGSRPPVVLRFNPRICKRCDMPMMFPIQTKMFQSTHL